VFCWKEEKKLANETFQDRLPLRVIEADQLYLGSVFLTPDQRFVGALELWAKDFYRVEYTNLFFKQCWNLNNNNAS